MTAPRPALVALGVGNVLLGDDAVGVRVIEALRAQAEGDAAAIPPGTRLVDGGTLGLGLLDTVRGARGLVLVDALRLGGEPGTVSVRSGDATAALGPAVDGGPGSPLGELLAVAGLMGWLPDAVTVVGVEAARLEPGLELSPAVAAAVPRAMEAVRDALCRMDEAPTMIIAGGAATAPLAGATA